MERTKQLGNESVGKLLLKFSIPAIIGMLVNALYNVVDRIFVGRGVGVLAISGISVTFPIMIINMAFGMLVGIGAASMVSIKLGQKKKDDAEKILGNALVLSIVLSILVSILGLAFKDAILKSFGASENTLNYAREYIEIILFGVVLQNIGFGLNNIIRAEGNPRIAMLTMIIGAVINTILNPIFIFVFHMGIRGSATATIISQAITSIWVIHYFLSDKSLLKFKKENLRLKKEVVISIFSIGMSPFAMQVAASLVNILFNKNLLAYGGDLAVGAMGIINSISMLIMMPMFGINQGAQPIIGFNYGAKQYDRVKRTLKLAIIAATGIAIFGFLITQLIPTQLVGIFNKSDIELMNISVNGMKIVTVMFPLIGFQVISSNFFQAMGKAKISMFLSLSRQVIILIPLIIIMPKFFALNGVWMASPISDFLSTVITAVLLIKEIQKLNKIEIENSKLNLKSNCS